MKRIVFGLLVSAATVCVSAQDVTLDADLPNTAPVQPLQNKPVELSLQRADSRRFDVRSLPKVRPVPRERVELEDPDIVPQFAPGTNESQTVAPGPSVPALNAPAPPPNGVFEGLDRFNWGAGSPPDTNGDVGPNHFIETVNTSIGIFRKSDGFLEAAFTFDTFMSQGHFGNLCDTNNFGDPVVLYDTFEDRWVITDFAFLTDAGGNVLAPAFQCFAVSQSGDPLAGGWNFYSRQISDALNDYPKFGIWPDGLYMSANLFSFGAGSSYKNARAWAFNKAQMYAGAPTVKVVQFDIGGGAFTVIPSNARLQVGTPPAGRPNLFVSTSSFLNAISVYKFHVDWNSLALSTFTGPDTPLAATSWPNASPANAAQPGTAQLLDVLATRAMVQNQYTNFGGTESLWVPHTVRRGNTTGLAAPRWYQADVTGGTVAANLPQATTWDPDGANVNNRFMPSLALDRAGNLAMGYSMSNGTTVFPSIMYAGRLAGDPANTFSLTEQTFFTGTASQTGIQRWGDYSAMTLDPDGCTFWYASEYANPADQTFNHRWLTKFGSIPAFPGCTPVGAGGTVSGTVTQAVGGAPMPGVTVMLGSRTTTTDGSGNYSFASIPAGLYPGMSASFPGFSSGSASNIAVIDGNTTTQNFSLAGSPASACVTDTTQGDFLTGVASATLDLNATPGSIGLSNAPAVDQLNTAGTTTGTGFGTPNWTGQTFIAGVSGSLVKADFTLFCSGCGATPPDLTLSLRATSGGLPTGADLATASVPGSTFGSGASVTYAATFAAPASVTAGTQYALVLRPVSAPAGSGYFWIRSSPSTYANGSRVLSADSGATWSADTTRDFNFHTFVQVGYAASGTFVSAPKDSNPSGGLTPIWSTLSWNAALPANTSLQFQVAGSNNVNGPFNFVGPDGTSGTFFTSSPVSLSTQFYNLRYIEYKAFFATSDPAQTPLLDDVTTCFNDTDCSTTQATITPSPTLVCSNSTGNTASGPAGMSSYGWGATNGTITSSSNTQNIFYTSGASGAVTLNLAVIAPNACMASNSALVNIDVPPSKPSISGTTAFCSGNSTTLSSDSADGNQWFLNGSPIPGATSQTYVATAAGDYTVQVSDANGCASTMSDIATVVVNTPPPTPVIVGFTNGTGTQDQACPEVPLTLSASGATGAVSYTWYKDIDVQPGETASTYAATGAATYYVTATDANSCTTSQSAGYVVQNPTPHSPFITFRGQASTVTSLGICQGTTQILDSDSATGIQWWKDGSPIPGAGSQSYTASAAGVYTAQLNALGCHSQFGRDATLSVTPTPAQPTVTPPGPVSVYAPSTVLLTSSSAVDNQWYRDGGIIAGATNPTDVANTSGAYTVVVTTSGCSSPSSTPTQVTVNPAQADLALTLTDHRNNVLVGGAVNYIIEITNPAGPSQVDATVTDTLPPGLANGSWTCIPFGGAVCNSGVGNVLNDSVTLPIGSEVAYVYSATVLGGDVSDSLANSAAVALTAGEIDPSLANNSASDTDLVHVFTDGFEGTPLVWVNGIGNGADFVTAKLHVDAGLLDGLSLAPTTVAVGRGPDGKALFTLELARFGNDRVVRASTRTAAGLVEPGAWQIVDLEQGLFSFAWQTASNASNGYLTAGGAAASLPLISSSTERDRLTQLWVTVQNSVPWLVVITQ